MEDIRKRSSRPKSRQSLAHIPSRSEDPGFDRLNATADISALTRKQDAQSDKLKKKSRGKSLGPGGLEALDETVTNIKNVPSMQIRSILKPTVPLTPPKTIPSFDELRKRNTGKATSPRRNPAEELLIDFSTPAPSREGLENASTGVNNILADPFSPIRNGLTDDEPNPVTEQDTSAEEKRQAEKKAILERRAARRKSLANRRVSFAPEATLHTWSVMELVEDSTTSSASNSTRRQSAMTVAPSPAPKQDLGAMDPPSTPPAQAEEPLVKASPAHQRDLHQKKRRRSSSMSADMDISDNDIYSSSPSGDVTTESSPVHVEESIDSESDTDGDTAMSMDMASHTMNSQESTHSSLDQRLRAAATQAGTRGIDYDEHGDDLSMDLVEGTVTNAFQPWVKNQHSQDDQENVGPFSPAQKAREVQTFSEEEDDETQGMTMEITRAVGGIVKNEASPSSRRKSLGARRRSSVARRQSNGADSSYGDESMDLTTVAGGILGREGLQDETDIATNAPEDDVTMEFTTAVGGVQQIGRRESMQSVTSDDNETMDMTAAVGGILAPIEEQTEPQTDFEDDKTTEMDMTKAVGQILSHQKTQAILQENQHSHDKGSIQYPKLQELPSEDEEATPHQLTFIASETGSPSRALKPRPSARSTRSSSRATTPKSISRTTPIKALSIAKQATPTKQMTPVPTRAATPERTPIVSNVTHRGASPKKLFQAEIKARASPGSAKQNLTSKRDLLFSKDAETGQQTPRVVLHAPKPHQHLRRRSSGIGIDREGFGSPKVSEMLDCRISIGESAPAFKLEPSHKGSIRFEDPCQIENEIDAERAEDERRESGRFVMTQEADERQEENATLQLKDLIESMTPRKTKTNKLKGRKSLAAGSARGLLGKRPVELDEDEDDADTTPKRLKAVSREGSPVKTIHLPKPPTKEETTGRLTRAQQLALDAQSGHQTPTYGSSPERPPSVLSPQHVSRFKEPRVDRSERPTSFEDKLDNVVGAIDVNITHPQESGSTQEEDKISLQEFLNMTNIHFIELSTTKRRHTMAQSMAAQMIQDDARQPDSLEATFVSAATTLPLLELYQHATRELKSYISTGRKIVKTIESETLADQPPLFREYVEARPDIKLVMDNQFRNGKTNARLQSKEGWYTWRSQLVDGLSSGLEGIQSDLQSDLAVLRRQGTQLDVVVPELLSKRQTLKQELASLQPRLAEIDSIDHEALRSRRQDLQAADKNLRERTEILNELKKQMSEKDEVLSQAAELKTELRDQIEEADRVRAEYRGWPSKDVVALKAKVDAIKTQTGWSLIGAESDMDDASDFGVALTLTYLDELRLFFYPSAFQVVVSTEGRRRSGRKSRSVSGPTAPISLTCTRSEEGLGPDLPTEKRFFLQMIRGQLQALTMMPKGSISAKAVLETVSAGWQFARTVSQEIHLLSMVGICNVTIQSDECLSVKLMLMLKERNRVDIEFISKASILTDGTLANSTAVYASAIYGNVAKLLDPAKTRKVQNALSREIEAKSLGEGAWFAAVQAFEQWHLTQTETRPTSAPKPTTSPRALTPPPASKSPVKRSPLAAKKATTIQKKALPVPVGSRPQAKQARDIVVHDGEFRDKENMLPTSFAIYDDKHKPAITPEMQEAMMQHTPVKRVGALRRSPIGGAGGGGL